MECYYECTVLERVRYFFNFKWPPFRKYKFDSPARDMWPATISIFLKIYLIWLYLQTVVGFIAPNGGVCDKKTFVKRYDTCFLWLRIGLQSSIIIVFCGTTSGNTGYVTLGRQEIVFKSFSVCHMWYISVWITFFR